MTVCQVVTTVDSPELAQRLARGAVEAGLAACGQAGGPITSTYRWRGAIEESTEHVVTFKTTEAAYPALAAYVREHHPYEVPEILCTPVADGHPDYLAWVEDQVGQPA